MTAFVRISVLALVLCAAAAQAADGALSEARVVQHTGEHLPLDAVVTDERGLATPIGRYFGGSPVVLVFGYYNCPRVCSTLMEGVLIGLAASGLPPRAFRVIGVSIDPRERAADAARKADAYRAAHGGVEIDLLTGADAQIRRLTRAAGIGYGYDAAVDLYAHPLAAIVLAPDGRITHYLSGVRFDPREMRSALEAAAKSEVGSLAERIFLRCAHYDASLGRYSLTVMSLVRALCAVLVLALGAWIWRRRTR